MKPPADAPKWGGYHNDASKELLGLQFHIGAYSPRGTRGKCCGVAFGELLHLGYRAVLVLGTAARPGLSLQTQQAMVASRVLVASWHLLLWPGKTVLTASREVRIGGPG